MKYQLISIFWIVVFLLTVTPLSGIRIKSADAEAKFGTSYTQSGPFKKSEIGEVVNLMKEAGVEWVRMSDVWKKIEPEKPEGSNHYYAWDKRNLGLVKRLTEADIEIMMTLNTFSEWAGSGLEKPAQLPKEEYLDDYYDFVYKTVQHYNENGAKVRYWQIQNEPNGTHWKAGDEDNDRKQNTSIDKAISYYKLLKIGAGAVKDACPGCKVTLSFSSGIIIDNAIFLRKLIQIGGANYFDIIDFHSNYWPQREEKDDINQYNNIMVIADTLKRTMQELNIQKPLWISESSVTSGMSVTINKKGTLSLYSQKHGLYTYEFQAQEVIKRFIMGFGSGVQRVAWNKFSDQEGVSKKVVRKREARNYKGLITINLEKKPSYYAYQVMTRKLKEFTDVKALNFGGDVFAYQFEVNGKDIYVLWAERESKVDLKMGKLKITEIDGKERIGVSSDLLVTSSPIFVEKLSSTSR